MTPPSSVAISHRTRRRRSPFAIGGSAGRARTRSPPRRGTQGRARRGRPRHRPRRRSSPDSRRRGRRPRR
ncbi:hypothetical protein C5E07_04180 [Pseudoclavibacter sp. RFBJ3]|nr:hypothetical protein C5B99_10150 [Pseudoclavibacter sp. Z016]PPF84722.1 hypothetical protein C5C12_04885 [Pseudoclavibacter sp. RFBJ5]PPF93725.1 hypothetical protein C5E07_04180 [Pseudoclavibacter sp. RFBJ3]PPF98442.1 hypothetical protein C5C19_07165 [Pseudoclavibacter sp. RFBH5]PPG24598.1 hypothetical protein C5E13_07705 [Pseudoclavibacter sp. RFBI4]